MITKIIEKNEHYTELEAWVTLNINFGTPEHY